MLKKTQILIFPVLFVSLVLGCTSEKICYKVPDPEKEINCGFEILGGELEGLNAINDISVYDSYIIVTSISLEDQRTIHIYDKETGRLLKDALKMGRGPKEVIFPKISEFDSGTGVHRFYDPSKSAILSCQIDSVLEKGEIAIEETLYSPPSANTHMFDMEDRFLAVNNVSFLWRDTTNVCRFEIRDKSGIVLSTWNEYPYFEDDRKRYIAYNECTAALSPDRTRLAVATLWGGILELFKLDDTKISPLFTGYYLAPEFDVEGEVMYARYNEKTLDSFSDVYAADDKVYASFGGRVLLLDNLKRRGTQRSMMFTDILIFDWSGKALECLHTDYQIERLCVDKECIYAVIKDKERKPYLGRINLTTL